MKTSDNLAFFTFQERSVFMPLRYIYPECMQLIDQSDQLYPLFCLRNDHCPKNQGCMDVLARRLDYLFTQVVPAAKMIVAYFKYRDNPDSIRAGIFMRDMKEPRLITLNRSAFVKFQREGVMYSWFPTEEYIKISPTPNIIPVESLLVKPYDR